MISRMPLLAGQALEAPIILATGWRVNQRFTSEDDPDRMAQPWEPPAFVHEQLPSANRASLSVEELQVPGGNPERRFARVLRGVLSEEQCAALLAAVNVKGFTPALLNIGNDLQCLRPDIRDGHRVIVDSPELAACLLEKIRPFLPEQLSDGSSLVGINERLRFLCYTPGQSFAPHCDGRYRRPQGHERAGDVSRITIQLYLHDIPESFGGATTFFPGEHRSVKHQPEAGSVLLFTQDLLHEGTLVTEGIKYTLRTEVMYEPPKPQNCRTTQK